MILVSSRGHLTLPWRRRALRFGLLLTLMLSSPVTLAQEVDAETRTLARDLAVQGAEAFERQDYVTALDRFERASQLYRAPSISIMQGRCLQRLGRLVAALDHFEETQRMPLADDAPDALRQAVADAKREGKELRPRIPRLTIRVRSGDRLSSSFTVWLDGKRLPAALFDVDRPIDPGAHSVEALAPGHLAVKRSVTLSEGERYTLELPVGETVGAGDAVDPTQPSISFGGQAKGTEEARFGSPQRTWGWVGIGIGGAGLVSTIVTGVLALDKKSSLDSICNPGCPPGSEPDIDAYRTYRTLSYVSAAVGVAAAGVGGYLLLSGSPSSSHVAVTLGPADAGIVGAF